MTDILCDVLAEQSVLGTLLIRNSLIDAAAAEITEEDFYDPLHRRIYRAVCQLAANGPVTPISLHAALRTDEGLKELGGLDYLLVLAQAAPASLNIAALASVLKGLAVRRRLAAIAADLAADANESDAVITPQQAADAATEALLQVSVGKRGVQKTPYEAAQETLAEAEDAAHGIPPPMVKTGLSMLDEEIGGFRAADLIIVPAASGMGKSSLLGGISLRTALAGVPTIVFSLEMTRRQWTDRLVCDLDYDTHARALWYSKFRNGRVDESDITRYALASRRLHGLPLEIVEDDDLTIEQITARARAFKAKHGGKLGIVLIDYLQIIAASHNRDRNREQEVSHIARGTKRLAKMLGWPVVAASQINEAADSRGDGLQRPRPGDVRESKVIRNEADLMLAPWREAHLIEERKATLDWRALAMEKANTLELICLKNRHGRRFDLTLWCEIGAGAIRDEEPVRDRAAAQALLV